MKPLVDKIKPTQGFSEVLHIGLLVLLPVTLFVLSRLGTQFVGLSLSLIVLSKWRMFVVRPRFWPAIIRANAVDIIVGIAVVAFMQHTTSAIWQLAWATLYGAWLLFLKPRSSTLMVSAQAFIGQLVGLMALFAAWPNGSTFVLVLLTGMICAFSARHFFDSFDEPYSKMLAYLWAYFGGALVWILSHWLLFYGAVAQPTLLLSTIGYGLAALYYFDHTEKLSPIVRRQFVFIIIAIVVIIIAFSDWGDKVV